MDDKQLEEAKALTDQLIKRAEENKHSKFEFIKNYEMWWAVKALIRSTIKVAKIFKKDAIASYKKYIKQLKSGIDNLQLLVNYRQSMKWSSFYFEESEIYKDMLYEFRCFFMYKPLTWLGIWWLGDQRKEEDLVDYSGLGFKEEDIDSTEIW